MASRSLRGLRAYIYDRNSRLVRPGTSTEDQRLENRRFCEREGMTVVGEFSDPGRSASRYAKQAREDYDRMVQGIGAGGCDVLVVWEASRGYRSTEAYLQLRNLCERKNVLICYNGRAYDMSDRQDRFTTGFDALRAEDEADQIRERNLRTVRLNAERRRPHGRIPYGYRREYDPDTGALLRQVPDEAQAQVLREAASRIAAGQSLYAVAKDLNARHVAPPGGARWWDQTTVRQVLLRPSNAGQRQFQGEVIGAASWDGILDEQLYYTVVGILTDPGRLNHRDGAVKYLLSGVALCGACLPVRNLLKSTPRRTYTCPVCFRVSIRADWFDAAVETAVLEHVSRPEFAASLLARDEVGAGGALAEARALEAQLEDARRLAATFEGGRFRLSAVSLAALEEQLLPRIAAARSRAVDAEVPEVVRRLAAGSWSVWHEQLDLGQRRTAIRSLVRVSLRSCGKGARTVTPERFGWEWLR